MYVCKDSAAPAHARTRAHRPAAPRQSSGVSQTPHPPAGPQDPLKDGARGQGDGDGSGGWEGGNNGGRVCGDLGNGGEGGTLGGAENGDAGSNANGKTAANGTTTTNGEASQTTAAVATTKLAAEATKTKLADEAPKTKLGPEPTKTKVVKAKLAAESELLRLEAEKLRAANRRFQEKLKVMADEMDEYSEGAQGRAFPDNTGLWTTNPRYMETAVSI